MNRNDDHSEGPRELVGLAEAAELLGLSKGALGERRRRPGPRMPVFPEPLARLACGPIWERTQIERYRDQYDEAATSGTPDDGSRFAAIDRVLAQLRHPWLEEP